jgi:AraC-like DNA-binding protein
VRQARLSARSDDLAAALGTSARSLAGRLRVGGLPPLRRFLLWGRLIEAAYLLSWERSTVEDTAFRVRYATGAALQGAFRRTLGASPLDVVERGGWRFVAEAAVTELRRSQTAHPPDPGTVQ